MAKGISRGAITSRAGKAAMGRKAGVKAGKTPKHPVSPRGSSVTKIKSA